MSSKKFFVYGTLKVGGHFAGQFDHLRKSSTVGTLHGMDLFNLGWFPTIKPGDGFVVGEVHEYDDEDQVLRVFDGIEGYNQARPEMGLYNRAEHEVVLESGETVQAIAYTLNGDVPGDAKKIEDGVWPLEGTAKA